MHLPAPREPPLPLIPLIPGLFPLTAGLVPFTAGLVPFTAGLGPFTAGLVPFTAGLVPLAVWLDFMVPFPVKIFMKLHMRYWSMGCGFQPYQRPDRVLCPCPMLSTGSTKAYQESKQI